MTDDTICTYCSRWNHKLSKPIEPMPAAQAKRRADRQRQAFTVIAWRDDDAYADMHVSTRTGVYQLQFHDHLGRVELYYRFERTTTGSLFLGNVVRYHYRDQDPHALRSEAALTTARFRQDGTCSWTDEDATGQASRTGYRDVDVTANYEPEPRFGDWTSILRRERDGVDPRGGDWRDGRARSTLLRRPLEPLG